MVTSPKTTTQQKKPPKKVSPKTDLDKALEGLNEVGRGDFWTPKEGKNIVRILPWTDVFFFKAMLHYGMKAPGGGRETAYPCLAMYDKECPACAFHEKLSESGSPGRMKLAQRVRQVTKYYVNVLDRSRPQDGIRMFGFSSKQMRTLRGFLEDEDYGDITDVDEGKDVVITREGTGFTNTSYEIRVRAKPTPLDFENWEEQIHNLSEVVKEVNDSFMRKRVEELKGTIGKKDEDEDEEPDKKKKGKGKENEDLDSEEDDKDEEED
jgi:hypothetical protein